jgi:presenilin-like A22 family membrane protease
MIMGKSRYHVYTINRFFTYIATTFVLHFIIIKADRQYSHQSTISISILSSLSAGNDISIFYKIINSLGAGVALVKRLAKRGELTFLYCQALNRCFLRLFLTCIPHQTEPKVMNSHCILY